MISEDERLLMIDQCEQLSASTFFIYKATWELIIKALEWSMQKTKETVEHRIQVCYNKELNMPRLARNWRLIIDTLKWVIEETPIDPIESRKLLGF